MNEEKHPARSEEKPFRPGRTPEIEGSLVARGPL